MSVKWIALYHVRGISLEVSGIYLYARCKVGSLDQLYVKTGSIVRNMIVVEEMLCLKGERAQKMLQLFICDHFYHSHIDKEYLTTTLLVIC